MTASNEISLTVFALDKMAVDKIQQKAWTFYLQTVQYSDSGFLHRRLKACIADIISENFL